MCFATHSEIEVHFWFSFVSPIIYNLFMSHPVMLHTIIGNFGLRSCCWLSFAETLVDKYTVRRDCSQCARGIVTLNDEGELENPSEPHFFFYLNNLMKTTHGDNYFYESTWSRRCVLWVRRKVYFAAGGRELGWQGDLVHLHKGIWKPCLVFSSIRIKQLHIILVFI